jgi:hypothetical protein
VTPFKIEVIFMDRFYSAELTLKASLLTFSMYLIRPRTDKALMTKTIEKAVRVLSGELFGNMKAPWIGEGMEYESGCFPHL